MAHRDTQSLQEFKKVSGGGQRMTREEFVRRQLENLIRQSDIREVERILNRLKAEREGGR